MFLQYASDGDLYSLQKTIELRDGKALPNSFADVNRAEKGEWPYLNLDEETTLQRISTTLSEIIRSILSTAASRHNLNRRALILSLFVVGSATCASAADAAAHKPSRFGDRLKTSNDWQFLPRVSKPRPSNNSEAALVREARDRSADTFGASIPLDELRAKGLGTGGGISSGYYDEILPDGPNQVVLVGEFRDFDVVLTSSRRSIYTEMHIPVERLLSHAATVRAGETISVLKRGGSLIADDGQVLNFRITPLPFVIRPQHRYLMFLRYMPEGDLYWLQKTIELRDGRALPNSRADVNRAERGEWPYLNMDEETTVQRISTARFRRLAHPLRVMCGAVKSRGCFEQFVFSGERRRSCFRQEARDLHLG